MLLCGTVLYILMNIIIMCRLPVKYTKYFIKCACCVIVGIFRSLEFCAISYGNVFILKESYLYHTLCQDFTSAGLFSNTEKGTGSHLTVFSAVNPRQ